MDNVAHQELLRRVVQKMGLQVEKMMELMDPMVDILVPEGLLSGTTSHQDYSVYHKISVADALLHPSNSPGDREKILRSISGP